MLERAAHAQPSPALLWSGRYHHTIAPLQLDEVLDSVEFQNHLYVTGEVRASSSTSFFATLKYELGAAGGNQPPVASVYWPSGVAPKGTRRAIAIAADTVLMDSDEGPTPTPRPTIYVTGVVPGSAAGTTDIYTIAYDENLSIVYWAERFDADLLNDAPVDISASQGKVAVFGTSEIEGVGSEICTLMYSGVDGSNVWTPLARFMGAAGDDSAAGGSFGVIVWFEAGLYVVGTVVNASTGTSQVAACRYDPGTGNVYNTNWPRFFAPQDRSAVATCMTVLEDRGLYVGGVTGVTMDAINQDYLTVSFASENPLTLVPWWDEYDHAGDMDRVMSIGARTWKPAGSVVNIVYVTGRAATATQGYNIVTRQYVEDGPTPSVSQDDWDAVAINGHDRGVALAPIRGGTYFTVPDIIVAGSTQSAAGNLNMVALKYRTMYDPGLGFSLVKHWDPLESLFVGPTGGDHVPSTLNRGFFDVFFMAGRSWGGATTADDMMSLLYTDP